MNTKDYVTEVTVNGLKCIRCAHEWLPRKTGELPLHCPKCHSSYWHRPRIRPQKIKIVAETNTQNTE